MRLINPVFGETFPSKRRRPNQNQTKALKAMIPLDKMLQLEKAQSARKPMAGEPATTAEPPKPKSRKPLIIGIALLLVAAVLIIVLATSGGAPSSCSTAEASCLVYLPTAPSSVTATYVSASSVLIKWTRASKGTGGDLTGYKITSSYSPDFSKAEQVVHVSSSSSSYIMGRLTVPLPSPLYFKVEAECPIGLGPPGKSSRYSNILPEAPQVTDINVNDGYSSLYLQYEQPNEESSSVIHGYKVYYALDNGGEYPFLGMVTKEVLLEDITEEGILLTGLLSGLRYQFAVRAMSDAGDGALSPVFRHILAQPPVHIDIDQVTCEILDHTSVHCEWPSSSARGSPILGYRIQAFVAENNEYLLESEVTFDEKTLSGSLTALNSGSTYYIRVVAESEGGLSSDNDEITEETSHKILLAFLPNPPALQSVLAPGTGSLTVNWAAPEFTGFANIESYTIQWSANPAFLAEETSSHTLLAETYSFTAEDDTAMYIRISSRNIVGDSEFSPVSGPHFVNDIFADSYQLQLFNPDLTSLVIAWIPPVLDSNIDIGFELALSDITDADLPVLIDTTELPAEATSLTYTALTTGHTYYAEVYATKDGNRFEMLVNASVGLANIASEPLTVSTVVDADTASLSWSEPLDDGLGEISSYDIEYATTASGPYQIYMNTETLEISVSPETIPCPDDDTCAYYFRVRAVNPRGPGAPSGSVLITIRDFSQPPQNVVVLINEDLAGCTVEWESPLSIGTPITEYVLELYSGTTEGTLLETKTLDAAAVTATLESLSPNTEYTVVVKANNFVGEGRHSIIPILTDVIPAAPTAVTPLALSASQISVSWELGTYQSGTSPVESFLIELESSEGIFSQTVKKPSLSTIFGNLTPGLAYSVRVAAKNSIQTSVFASVDAFQASITPSPPSFPKFTSSGVSNVVLQWEPPLSDGGSPLTVYRIHEIDISSGTEVITKTSDIPASETLFFINIASLPKKTPQHYRLSSVNEFGESSLSSLVYFIPVTSYSDVLVKSLDAVDYGVISTDRLYRQGIELSVTSEFSHLDLVFDVSLVAPVGSPFTLVPSTEEERTLTSTTPSVAIYAQANAETAGEYLGELHVSSNVIISTTEEYVTLPVKAEAYVWPTSAGVCPGEPFREKDGSGLVIAEMESLDLTDSWSVQSTVLGASGASYIEWKTQDASTVPAVAGSEGVLSIPFEVTSSGEWALRMRTAAPSTTLHNDVYIQFPTTGAVGVKTNLDGSVSTKNYLPTSWTTVYSSAGADQWTWDTSVEADAHELHFVVPAIPAGSTFEFEVKLSARSSQYKIDRLSVYLQKPSDPTQSAVAPEQGETIVTQESARCALDFPALPPLPAFLPDAFSLSHCTEESGLYNGVAAPVAAVVSSPLIYDAAAADELPESYEFVVTYKNPLYGSDTLSTERKAIRSETLHYGDILSVMSPDGSEHVTSPLRVTPTAELSDDLDEISVTYSIPTGALLAYASAYGESVFPIYLAENRVSNVQNEYTRGGFIGHLSVLDSTNDDSADIYYINSGSDQTIGIWSPDAQYNYIIDEYKKYYFETTPAIQNMFSPATEEMYWSERYGKDFSYFLTSLDVGETGTKWYDVTLYFAEHFATAVGQRVFHVKLNGENVLPFFDILKFVPQHTAFAVTVPVKLTSVNPHLRIEFEGVFENAKISAVEVQPSTPTAQLVGSPVYTSDGTVATFDVVFSSAESSLKEASIGVDSLVLIDGNGYVLTDGVTFLGKSTKNADGALVTPKGDYSVYTYSVSTPVDVGGIQVFMRPGGVESEKSASKHRYIGVVPSRLGGATTALPAFDCGAIPADGLPHEFDVSAVFAEAGTYTLESVTNEALFTATAVTGSTLSLTAVVGAFGASDITIKSGGKSVTKTISVLADWVPMAELPIGLGELSAEVIDGKMYMVGEVSKYGDGTENGATLAYDFATNTWTSDLARRVYQAHHHASVAFGGKLYLFGGLGSASESHLQIYDPVLNTWSEGSPLPIPSGAAIVAVMGTEILCCGGVAGGNKYTSSECAVYHPLLDSWSVDMAPMPQGRHSAAYGVDGTKLYVFGGRDGKNTVTYGYDTIQIYDRPTNTWFSSDSPEHGFWLSPLPQRRSEMGSAPLINGEFYICGGESAGTDEGANVVKTYTRCDVYNPAKNSWRQGSELPLGRQGMDPVAYGGHLYACGGGYKNSHSQSTTCWKM